jgi:cyclopropane-fatty-acyl-phospholipid synthase
VSGFEVREGGFGPRGVVPEPLPAGGERPGSRAAELRWLCGEEAILGSDLVRRSPFLEAFSRLLHAARSPLLGALTLVFDGHALQYGAPSAADATLLTAIHRDADGSAGDAPPPLDGSAAAFAFDLGDPDLGLGVERERRHPLPRARDLAPGQWIDPVVKVRAPDFFVRVLTRRNLGLGEAFLEGQFEMLRGSVHHLVAFFLVNEIDRQLRLSRKEQAKLLLQYAKWRWHHSHNEDIADHYDVGDNLMVPMLGATGCYSCGYLEQETDDLDRMQLNKMNLIFSKMRLQPGMRILDTGCGNGGMLVHAALGWGCHGEGFTNSYNMASLARRNAERNGVADRVAVHHADFSILETYPDQHFDAIYEVGVWEHLPFRQYAEVMKECRRILKPHGRMLIHSMGSHQVKHRRDGYIQKYIFRDSNQVRLHRLLTEACRQDMYVADVENLGRHYYWTLWYWRKNLIDAFERDPRISERDFRVQLYFLECGMAESRFGDGSVYHVLLFKNARDYRKTWRVDGRMHEPGRGAIASKPLTMEPCDRSEHLHNDPFAEHKFESPVYRRPSLGRRIAHWIDTVRSVTHQ